jgi:hypothetical protein
LPLTSFHIFRLAIEDRPEGCSGLSIAPGSFASYSPILLPAGPGKSANIDKV